MNISCTKKKAHVSIWHCSNMRTTVGCTNSAADAVTYLCLVCRSRQCVYIWWFCEGWGLHRKYMVYCEDHLPIILYCWGSLIRLGSLAFKPKTNERAEREYIFSRPLRHTIIESAHTSTAFLRRISTRIKSTSASWGRDPVCNGSPSRLGGPCVFPSASIS